MKDYNGKLTNLESRISSEIGPLKKAVGNYETLSKEVSKLSTRDDDLFTWKHTAERDINSLKAHDTKYEKLLDSLPQWKTQVDQRLVSSQAKFEDFLTQHWRPHKKKFDNMLDEWQPTYREKRTRVVAEISDDKTHDDERDLYDNANNDVALPMAERDGAPVPSRSPKRPKKPQP